MTIKAAGSSSGYKRKRRHRGFGPIGPKRPMVPYMFFCKANRKKVVKQNPSATFGQIGRLLGQRWNGLTPRQKKPYQTKSAHDRKRYHKQMRRRRKHAKYL